jgi:hypothetical protein
MPRKYIPSCWQLVPAPVNDHEPAPELLTDEELAQVNTLYEPLDAVIEDFIETHDSWPFDAILEALARLTDYYEGMEAHISAEIDAEIAAEEADA